MGKPSFPEACAPLFRAWDLLADWILPAEPPAVGTENVPPVRHVYSQLHGPCESFARRDYLAYDKE